MLSVRRVQLSLKGGGGGAGGGSLSLCALCDRLSRQPRQETCVAPRSLTLVCLLSQCFGGSNLFAVSLTAEFGGGGRRSGSCARPRLLGTRWKWERWKCTQNAETSFREDNTIIFTSLDRFLFLYEKPSYSCLL